MTGLRRPLAILVALTCVCLSGAAEANGHGGLTPQDVYSPGWREGAPAIVAGAALSSGSAVLDEAGRWIGAHNPTGFAGPWCKAFTNFVLERLGFHPGPSLQAIDALRDGHRVADPAPGDLAVMPHHVTFFVRWLDGDRFVGLGGNQGNAVAESIFSRRAVVAFVRP